jgi:uncharacterized protein
MSVFDIHHHVGGLTLGGEEDIAPTAEDEAASRIKAMETYGINAAAVMPSLQYDRTDGIDNTRRVNDAIAAYRDAHPEYFPCAFGTVEPLHNSSACVEEINRLASLNMKGVVWHSRFQGVFLADRRLDPLVDAASAHGMVVLIHIIAESTMEPPWALEALAERHPETTFVALDAFTGPSQSEHIIHIARRRPNVLFETAGAFPLGRVLERFIAAVGHRQLIFGSDFYASPPWWRAPQTLVELQAAPLDKDVLEDILWRNAHSLLGLS